MILQERWDMDFSPLMPMMPDSASSQKPIKWCAELLDTCNQIWWESESTWLLMSWYYYCEKYDWHTHTWLWWLSVGMWICWCRCLGRRSIRTSFTTFSTPETRPWRGWRDKRSGNTETGPWFPRHWWFERLSMPKGTWLSWLYYRYAVRAALQYALASIISV